MKRPERMLAMTLALTLLPAAWAGATERAQLLQPVLEIQQTVFKNHKDAYYKDCKMKW